MSLNAADSIHKTDIIKNMKLRLVTELPLKYQYLFSEYPCFNGIQSQIMDDILYTDIMKPKLILFYNLLEDESIVVTSPTGSGKTVLFEFGIIHLLEQMQSSQDKCDFKILYMAPLKALCTERLLDWGKRFNPLGLKCIELTGDSDISELNSAYNYQLILTTPEKWDSLTRKWRNHENFIKSVQLFLIDEAHILNEEKRGATLEAVVSRMKLLNQCTSLSKNEKYLRFIALSATITNIQDIAVWLGRTHNSPAIFRKIGNEMRPVTLRKVVKGYTFRDKQSQYQFDINLSYKIKEILFEYSEGKPTLIFCSTRNGVQQTSNVLSRELSFSFNEEQKQKLIEASSKLTDSKLSELVISGIGYHHAGMLLNDKHHIMKLFQNGYLPILVATSTLAMGVNLPAHLVIVKSTQHYVDGTFKEYSEVQLLQMIGRAGRPQYDTSATAVIMTADTNKAKYEQLISGVEIIESSLHKHLAEYLNAEIVLGTITDIPVAMDWIRSTFLYIRASVNPKYYGISPGLSKEAFEGKLQDMCMRELNSLVRSRLVIIKNGYDIQTNENGMLMAHYCISLETMKIYMQLKGTETLEDMISLLSHAYEFSDINLRVNEKSALNYMNRNNSGECIRFPIKGRITTKFMKINCLLQSVLSCLPINDTSLNQDAVRILRLSQRLMKAFSSYIWRQPYYKSLVNSTILTKCLECKLWENSPYVVRQLPGIGSALASLLVSAGKTTFKAVADANPRDLERILNRHPPFGNHLQETVWRIPQYNLEMVSVPPRTVTVTVTLMNADEASLDNACNNQKIVLLVGDSENRILHKEKILNSGLLMKNSVYTLTVPIIDNTGCTHIEANLISDTWVGIDKRVVVYLPQQSKTSVQNRKEDKVGIKINSQQTNSHFLISEKMKTCCTTDLKRFSFTPKKSIQLSTLNSSKLTYDSKAVKTNKDITHSNSSTQYQHCVNSSDSKIKDNNFVDLDDLLDDNLSNKNLLPATNKLTSPASHHSYTQTKKSVAFLLKNTSSSFEKQSLGFENVLPVSFNNLLEKQDKMFARDKNKNLECPSKQSFKEDLHTRSVVNLKNIFPMSDNKLLEYQHKLCTKSLSKKPICSSEMSKEQDLQTESFFNVNSTFPVSVNELLDNQQKIQIDNVNDKPICLSKLSCGADLQTKIVLNENNLLPASDSIILLEDQNKICTRNINKNLIRPAKLSLKEDFKTETIFSQKHEFPSCLNRLLKSSQDICARNKNTNRTKPIFEVGLKTEAIINQKKSLLTSTNQPLKSTYTVCAGHENINSTNSSESLNDKKFETENISEMKQSEIKLDPTACIDLIPEKNCNYSQSSNNSQIQIQRKNVYYPLFLSLNGEIHGKSEHNENNVTLTSDVDNCDKETQRIYNSGNFVNAKNDQKDSLNCMSLSVDSNNKVLDKMCDHHGPCKNNTEKQQKMRSYNDLSKNELSTNCLIKMQLQESNDSGNLNDEQESKKECSSYKSVFEENNEHNNVNDTIVGEEFSNDTDIQEEDNSHECLSQDKKLKGTCLSKIYESFSDMKKDNLSLHTSRNFKDVHQVENIDNQGNKHSTLYHQSFVNIRQEKCLSQSGRHSSMVVSSTIMTKLNGKYELDVKKSFFQANNTAELKPNNYKTPFTDKIKTDCKTRYNMKNIVLSSELKTNSLKNVHTDKRFVFHSVNIPTLQKGQEIAQCTEDTSDLAETEEYCVFPSSVSNYEAERNSFDTTDKCQQSTINRHFECMLNDGVCHNNDVSFSQKEAFQELYGDMNYLGYSKPVSKNVCDSNSAPFFSSNIQSPNLVYRGNEEKEVQKTDNLFSDETSHLLDLNLPQFNVEHRENCRDVHRNNNVSIKGTSSETADNKQYFNWFCGNNIGSNKDFNLSINEVKINDKRNRDYVCSTPVDKLCKKSSFFNIHSQSYKLCKTENHNFECKIPVKRIKFEN